MSMTIALGIVCMGQVSNSLAPPPLPTKPIETSLLRSFSARPKDSPKIKGYLLFFMTTDCPIANRYAPEISRIFTTYSKQDIECLRIYVDPATTQMEAKKHGSDFQLTMMSVLDSKHLLVNAIGISATPEVALITPIGRVAYRGRIDDTYIEHGRPRDKATRRDLRIALDEFLAGKPISIKNTPAIGCGIPPLPPPQHEVSSTKASLK